MNKLVIILAITYTLGLSACATKQETGTAVGAATGAVLGSTIGDGRGQFIATAVGLMIGAIVGQEIGRSIDVTDERQAQEALERNKTGETTTWVNPDSGGEISVVPTRTYKDKSGDYCREYTTEVEVAGKKETAFGTACRQPDGSWKIVK
ncbi:RT0821/Lpp0805 family surface protein [Pseudomonadota bacterium]